MAKTSLHGCCSSPPNKTLKGSIRSPGIAPSKLAVLEAAHVAAGNVCQGCEPLWKVEAWGAHVAAGNVCQGYEPLWKVEAWGAQWALPI